MEESKTGPPDSQRDEITPNNGAILSQTINPSHVTILPDQISSEENFPLDFDDEIIDDTDDNDVAKDARGEEEYIPTTQLSQRMQNDNKKSIDHVTVASRKSSRARVLPSTGSKLVHGATPQSNRKNQAKVEVTHTHKSKARPRRKNMYPSPSYLEIDQLPT